MSIMEFSNIFCFVPTIASDGSVRRLEIFLGCLMHDIEKRSEGTHQLHALKEAGS